MAKVIILILMWLFLLVFIFIEPILTKHKVKNDHEYGSARFATFKEIKRLLLGKDTTYYINPLEIYKYYTGRNNRITLIKLIILISQNNAKFTNQDIGALMHFEKLLRTIFISSDSRYENIKNIFSNYLKALELECQKQPANLINLKAINRINKELIITLEKYLKNEKITEEAPKSLTIEKLDNAKK